MNLRLKEIRTNLGLKQSEFASKLNLSTSAICDYEKGRRRITERTLNDICSKFNVNKDWFESGKVICLIIFQMILSLIVFQA